MNRFFSYFFITLLLLVQLAQNVYADENIENDESSDVFIEEIAYIDNNEKDKNLEIKEDITKWSNNYDYEKYKVNFVEIKDKWIKLNNDLRENIWENKYYYNDKLDKTAQEWAEIMAEKWEATHKRNSWDSYYNYKKITSWFESRWLEFENINRATFSESIWYWNYTCNIDDCTKQISESVERVHNRFMEERNKKYQPHYRAFIKKEFKEIWLWMAIKEIWKWRYEFYLTIHYWTNIL